MLRATIAALFFAYASVGALHLQPRAAPTRRGSDVRCSLAVFGATGQLGSECVYQALARGEKVVALARTPSKLVVPEGSGGTEAGAPLTSDAPEGSATASEQFVQERQSIRGTGAIIKQGPVIVSCQQLAVPHK